MNSMKASRFLSYARIDCIEWIKINIGDEPIRRRNVSVHCVPLHIARAVSVLYRSQRQSQSNAVSAPGRNLRGVFFSPIGADLSSDLARSFGLLDNVQDLGSWPPA